jgi:hypothetical protein
MCRGSSVVERRPEKAGVASSILAPGTIHALYYKLFAACATLCTNLRAKNGLKSAEAGLELALASNAQCLRQERLPKGSAALDDARQEISGSRVPAGSALRSFGIVGVHRGRSGSRFNGNPLIAKRTSDLAAVAHVVHVAEH